MKRTLLSIGLLCVVVAGICLLYLNYHTFKMSDSAVTTIPAAQIATSTVPVAATTSSISITAASPVSVSIAVPAPKVTPMHFEIVTTVAAQEQGLGGRAVIPDNYAMLFVFPSDQTVGFWMKDMLTPIDMIWLTDNGTISGIVEDALPSSYPDVFYPPFPTRYVLETRVGLAKERGWTIGTNVQLPLPY